MIERVYKTKISDIRLETVLFDEAFHMKISGGVSGIMSHIKHMHKHSTYEIFFVIDGKLDVMDMNGCSSYDKKIVVVPPNYDHYVVSDVKNGYCFYFSIKHLASSDGELFAKVDKELSEGVTSFELNEDILFYLTRFVKEVDREALNEKTSHLLYLLFSDIFERSNFENAKPKFVKSQNKYIHIIESYINNCENKLSIKELSGELYLSEKQVSRIIKKEYGCTFSELVNRRRLSVACSLLKRTDLGIGEIASAVGYEYENYFFALFKKAFGVTPLQYRKGNQNKDDSFYSE